ncbi:unnamed protein product [Allacma fusca]|uniref:SAM domain-containing protein n=1 Tax=Allacma fusca TaxID=39272 RepID=A0A8J2LUN0_9HEXA|nr:unnamed protein product [Allacma fusca]
MQKIVVRWTSMMVHVWYGAPDVPAWLKSLRLHKYSFLFAHICFEEMMELTEECLETQGVTKGARHKIVLSIAKLRDRASHLKQIHEEMTADKESIRNALNEVKWVLTTPIKPIPTENDDVNSSAPSCIGNSDSPSCNVGTIGSNRYSEEKMSDSFSDWQAINQRNRDSDMNLPSCIVRVIGKACELNPDPECEGLLVSVLDKCLSHDAFTYKQKRLLSLWRQQQAPIARRNSNGHHHFHSHLHRSNGSPGSGNNGNAKHNRHFSPKVLSLGNQVSNNVTGGTPSSWSPGSSIHAMFMAKRPSLQDSILESARSHLSVQRTKSAPLPNFFSSLSCSPPIGSQFDQLSSGIGTGNSHNSAIGTLGGLDFSSAGLLGTSSNSGDNNSGSHQTTSGVSSAMDITSRLESLCLSMTEAALGPAFNSY